MSNDPFNQDLSNGDDHATINDANQTPAAVSADSRPSGEFREEKKKKRKGLLWLWCVIGVVIVGGVVGTGFHLKWWQKNAGPPTNFPVIGKYNDGTPGVSRDDVLRLMQEEADKSKIHFRMNSHPIFANGRSEGDLYIINPVDNGFYMQVEIYLEETEELIYKTDLIPPNSYIDNDKLSKVLEKGEHKAKAIVLAYDLEDPEKQLNKASVGMLITVQA